MNSKVRTALTNLVKRVSKVRRWLVALAVLTTAAAGFLFVTLYVAAYSVLDHYLRMGTVGRCISLALFAAGLAYILWRLLKSLRSHTTASGAACHIESRCNLDQQLVTAIEYHENNENYPYSRALAERLVLQVSRLTSRLHFDRTVPKWQAHLSIVIITVGLITGGAFLAANFTFFKTYVARLAHPTAEIAPLPATTLVSLSKDVTAEYGSEYSLSAEIRGRIPQEGKIEIASAADASKPGRPRTKIVFPNYGKDVAPHFKVEPAIEVGRYTYRFSAGEAQTDWHALNVVIAPKIKEITASVTPPDSRTVEPFTRRIEDYRLEAFKGSSVTLKITATERLSRALVEGANVRINAHDVHGLDTFEVDFLAIREGRMRFTLESVDGISNSRIPPLEITLQINEPPEVELASPDGDYLATDVASVPLAFEVTDDFGLEEVVLNLEMTDGRKESVNVPIEAGQQTATLAHTLELEDYNLEVGDSIIFHASATDAKVTTSEAPREVARSQVYFLEIRPYKVTMSDAIPRTGLPPEVSQIPPYMSSLLDLLEYTRAILKKTWLLAEKKTFSVADRTKIASIKKDTEYCSEQLTLIRDDPRAEFTSDELSTMDGILNDYDKIAEHLSNDMPSLAIEPEKRAYRELRKLVDELFKRLPPPGQGVPPETPDRVILEDPLHAQRYDSERVEQEAREIAQDLDKAKEQEEEIKESFDHFIEEDKKKDVKQETTDERSWTDENWPQTAAAETSPGEGGQPRPSRLSIEGALIPPTPSQSPGAKPGDVGEPASPSERMRMLQARQRALTAEVESLQKALQRLPEPPPGEGERAEGIESARREADRHLDDAREDMGSFQDILSRLYFEEDDEWELAEGASLALDDAAEHIGDARDVLAESVEQKLPDDDPLVIAEELILLAEDFEQSTEPSAQVALTNAVTRAQGMLEQSGMSGQGTGAAGSGAQRMAATSYRKDELTRLARLLAMRFWTIAIEARKVPSSTAEDEASSAALNRLENLFYESAARYKDEADNR
ncbi:MAG: hypothetical protein ACYTAN_10420 [Planctomycetota bacterium]|jgi:hypothetical protein